MKEKIKYKWYNNTIDEKMYPLNKQPDGWSIGRLPFSEETKQRSSESAKKRGANNKGKKLSNQARKNMSESKLRFLQEHPDWKSPTQWETNHTPWNKGLTKETDSRVAASASTLKNTIDERGEFHYSEDTKLQKRVKEINTRIRNSGNLEQSYKNSVIKSIETRNAHKESDKYFNQRIQLKADRAKIER